MPANQRMVRYLMQAEKVPFPATGLSSEYVAAPATDHPCAGTRPY